MRIASALIAVAAIAALALTASSNQPETSSLPSVPPAKSVVATGNPSAESDVVELRNFRPTAATVKHR